MRVHNVHYAFIKKQENRNLKEKINKIENLH